MIEENGVEQSRSIDWAGEVARWRTSGESKASYCRRHGLTYARFNYWERKGRTHEVTELVALGTKGEWLGDAKGSEWQSTELVVRVGGVGIEVGKGFDKKALVEVLTVLKAG